MMNLLKLSKLSKLSPLLFTLLFLFSCSTSHFEGKDSRSVVYGSELDNQSCAQASVTLTTNFPTGRMDECKLVAENEYLITLVPENTPINSSPWYAFKIQAKQTTDITITMKVRGDEHRYPPKISRDGKTWRLQKFQLKGDRLIMNITASSEPVTIAAQEIINNQYYIDWAKKLTKDNTVTHSELGKSTQGRSIYTIERRNKKAKEWLVILGRQHPPEVTGALALFPFVETLISDTKLSQRFLEKYNVLVIPNINPDGVHAGNWRHNANGLDLNRDWNNFSQVETKLINDYLQQLVKQGQKISFAIDFHSTKSDVFYTMPVDYGVEKSYFAVHWLDDLDKKMPNFNVVIKPGNNPDLGVSKQYFADKFGVHAITYEMGDDTDRTQIKRIAFNSANLLMTSMLSDENHNKE